MNVQFDFQIKIFDCQAEYEAKGFGLIFTVVSLFYRSLEIETNHSDVEKSLVTTSQSWSNIFII